MAMYAPPRIITDVFNESDYTFNNEEFLTLFECNQRYIIKSGDIVTGSLIFENTNVFNQIQEFYNDCKLHNKSIQIYDATNTLKCTIDSTGITIPNITFTGSINGVTPTTLSYLDPTSSIQGQINAIVTVNNTQTVDIANNTADILTNTANIANNTSNIATNTSQIATNTANISSNASNIATNTANISTNTSNITTLQNKTTDMLAYNSGTSTSEFQNKIKASDLTFTNTINSINTTVFSYLTGVTSNIQTQLNNIITNIRASNNTWTGTNQFNKPITIQTTTYPQVSINYNGATSSTITTSNTGTLVVSPSNGEMQVQGGVHIGLNSFWAGDIHGSSGAYLYGTITTDNIVQDTGLQYIPIIMKVSFSHDGTTKTFLTGINTSNGNISRSSTGIYNITFTNAYSSANYVCIANAQQTSSGQLTVNCTAKSTTGITIQITNDAGSNRDPSTWVDIVCY